MKKIFQITALFLLFSCSDAKTDESVKLSEAAPVVETKADEPLSYPALYTDWEIGKREHLNTVLSVYKDWDEENVNNLVNYFADSVVLDMPDGKRTAGTKDEVVGKMEKFRNAYSSTNNQVLNAIPLLNKGTNIQWVRVMVYNKWTYRDNKKDSLLYYDLWRFKGDKIDYLLSLQQSPSRLQVKQLEKMADKLK
jgi:hypothetical protein